MPELTELKCNVQTCLHNKNFYCDREGIVVGGSTARRAEETCCDSFEERKESMMNAAEVTGSASPTSKIDCKATDCMYNHKCECHAGKINVGGSHACKCGETECGTFECGCA